MADAFEEIDQYVIVMMENRSFDHALGYLSLAPWNQGREPVNGVDPFFVSPTHGGKRRRPFRVNGETRVDDLPHDRRGTWTQMAERGGSFAMDGWVRAAYKPDETVPANPPTLGYLTPPCVPVLHHLATHFRVCDRWFTPIPTNTHPNRLMAVAGWTPYDGTAGELAMVPRTVLDFLTKHHVPWRVYARRASMFSLITPYTREALSKGDRFPPWARFEVEWGHAPTGPSVWFVEPGYSSIPWGPFPREDDHPPLTCMPGQAFLREVYRIVRSNDARWMRTLMIVVWDEHGGFYDHVPPLRIRTRAPRVPHQFQQAIWPDFPCTGPRVPAVLVSPWVEPASTATAVFDHTSILRTLVEKFGPGDRDYFVDSSGDEVVFSRPVSVVSAEVTRTSPRVVPRDLPSVPTVTQDTTNANGPLADAFRLAASVAGVPV